LLLLGISTTPLHNDGFDEGITQLNYLIDRAFTLREPYIRNGPLKAATREA
jgi:hypothetical protein